MKAITDTIVVAYHYEIKNAYSKGDKWFANLIDGRVGEIIMVTKHGWCLVLN